MWSWLLLVSWGWCGMGRRVGIDSNNKIKTKEQIENTHATLQSSWLSYMCDTHTHAQRYLEKWIAIKTHPGMRAGTETANELNAEAWKPAIACLHAPLHQDEMNMPLTVPVKENRCCREKNSHGCSSLQPFDNLKKKQHSFDSRQDIFFLWLKPDITSSTWTATNVDLITKT